jgi:hypothetical protein
MLSTKIYFIWGSGFRREDFSSEIDQSETIIVCDFHVCNRIGDEMNNLFRRPSINASYHVSVHLGKELQWRTFIQIDHSPK